MKIAYTREGLRDVVTVFQYILQQSPQGAENVLDRVEAILALLAEHPQSGRVVSPRGLRRYEVTPYPYAIFYRLRSGQVVIHGLRHTARRVKTWR